MGKVTIDKNEEVDFIVDSCYECSKDEIIQILDLFYQADEHGIVNGIDYGDPANHSKRIAEETNIPQDLVALVFKYQFEFLKEQGLSLD